MIRYSALFFLLALGAGGEWRVSAQENPTNAVQSPAAGPAASTAAAAEAEASVEGYLFFAVNDPVSPPQEEKVPVDAAVLGGLENKLRKVFPYTHYHLIGRHTQKVFKEYESWVVPSKDLCLKIDSRGPAGERGVSVHLQLWQDTKVLVKSDAVLLQNKPIFLGGPEWRRGRLIFVVRLQ